MQIMVLVGMEEALVAPSGNGVKITRSGRGKKERAPQESPEGRAL